LPFSDEQKFVCVSNGAKESTHLFSIWFTSGPEDILIFFPPFPEVARMQAFREGGLSLYEPYPPRSACPHEPLPYSLICEQHPLFSSLTRPGVLWASLTFRLPTQVALSSSPGPDKQPGWIRREGSRCGRDSWGGGGWRAGAGLHQPPRWLVGAGRGKRPTRAFSVSSARA